MYNKYRLRNITKNKYEFVWVEKDLPPPNQSVENPGDAIDPDQTAVVESSEEEFSPDDSSFSVKVAIRLSEVDRRTGELIDAGFVYNGVVFSLSSLAQTNWIGLKQADQNDFITYPFGISTKNDSEYLLLSKQQVTDFYIAGLQTKMYHLGSGRALKVQIKAAINQAQLDAVEDNR